MGGEPKPLELPRGLIFLSALWLIGSWIIEMGLSTPVQISSASYTPNFRRMLICIIIGLMIGWPLLRLSQRAQHLPLLHTILDMAVLISLIQIILWPLRLITPWSTLRTAAIDATMCSWLLLAGGVVAAAMGTSRAGPRNLAMFACICLCLLGPALGTVGADLGFNQQDLIELSPLMAVNTLTDGGGAPPSAAQWRWIALLAGAALAVWTALGMTAIHAARKHAA